MAQNCCKCIKSKCLKLYCSCFAKNLICKECDCRNCYNNEQFKEERMRCVATILKRNPNAFMSKVIKSDKDDQVMYLAKGCSCKHTNCVKKYCPCVHAGAICTESCYCKDCKNICNIKTEQTATLEDLNTIEVHKIEKEEEKVEEEKIHKPMEGLNDFQLDERKAAEKENLKLQIELVDREIAAILKKIEEEDNQNETCADIFAENLEVVKQNPKKEFEYPNLNQFVQNMIEHFKDKTIMENIVRGMLETAKVFESMNASHELSEHQVIYQLGNYLKMLIEYDHSWRTEKTRKIELYNPNP